MTSPLVVEIQELIALKQRVRREHCRLPVTRVQAGNHLSRFRGRGMDFAETRHYQAGDEVRHMEWRVTARTGRPHVKIFQEERERPVIIMTDFSPSMFFGTRHALKSVVAAKLAALIAWTAVKQQDKVGALLFGADTNFNEFTPRAREAGIMPLLAGLSARSKRLQDKNKVASTSSFVDALIRLKRVARHGSVLVIISDFYHLCPEAEKHLRHLQGHCSVLMYHCADALELAAPAAGNYAISNGSSQLSFSTEKKSTTHRYQQWCAERQLLVKNVCCRLQIRYSLVQACDDLAQTIAQTYLGRSGD